MLHILKFPSLPSTHAYAKAHLADLADRSVIVAATQTQGRGRKDRTWISDEGGLYCTLVLTPPFSPHLHNLTQLLCLAVCRAVESAGLRPTIKWPNDVLLEGKKLAGILSEAVFSAHSFQGLLLGVGVNIAQQTLRIEGREVTSLLAEDCAVSCDDFLSVVLDCFFESYERVLENGFAAIRAAYLARFDGLGKRVTVATENGLLPGTIKTVSEEGKLVLVSDSNIVHEVLMGECV